MRQAIHWLTDGSAEILDPALRYALATDASEQSEVLTEFRGLKGEGIQPYCFDCWRLTGNRYPVIFRGPGFDKDGIRLTCPHFFHEKNHDRETHDRAAKKHGGESIAHSVAKTVVAQIEKGKADTVDVSKEVPVTERGVNRRPDVVSTYQDGNRHAHEIQYSRIELGDLQRRTLDLLKAGFGSVSWYLFRQSYTAENRAWLASQAQVLFFYATLKNTEDPNNPEVSISPGTVKEEKESATPKASVCKFTAETKSKPESLKSFPAVFSPPEGVSGISKQLPVKPVAAPPAVFPESEQIIRRFTSEPNLKIGQRLNYIGDKYPFYKSLSLVASEFTRHYGSILWACSYPDRGRPPNNQALTTWIPEEDLEGAA